MGKNSPTLSRTSKKEILQPICDLHTNLSSTQSQKRLATSSFVEWHPIPLACRGGVSLWWLPYLSPLLEQELGLSLMPEAPVASVNGARGA